MVTAAIIGASGYIGGELVRLLLGHPFVDLRYTTSQRHTGRPLHHIHSNLLGATDLVFSEPQHIEHCDVLFLCMRHGQSHLHMKDYLGLADVVIDLSADFRLKDADTFRVVYRDTHQYPQLLNRFVAGIPEFYAETIASADFIAVPGCMANAGILAIRPIVSELEPGQVVFIDAKSGSSGSGGTPSPATHHPTRSGTVRVFQPAGHRHEAEIDQQCGIKTVMSACSIDAVRGVHLTIFCRAKSNLDESLLLEAYRDAYRAAPFVRVKTARKGGFSLPEPGLLSGTNYCDVGYSLSADRRSIVLFAALDNLIKGGAGNAIQSMNIRFGLKQTDGLSAIAPFP